MGSLMAGWDSPKFSCKRGYERKGSFTRSEIDMFWKSRHELEDRHMKEATEIAHQQVAQKLQELKSHDLSEREMLEREIERSLDKMANSCDWWTKSSWAFLNDPRLQAMDVVNQSKKSKK